MNLSLTLPIFLMPILPSLVSLRAVDAWIPASKLDQHYLPVFAAQHEHDERRKNGRIATTATADRRQLLKAIWRNAVTTSTVALVDIAAVSTPGRSWASSDGGDDKVEGLACQIGNKKLKRKISDVREAVEMTVQASSVQAWPSAAESINDTMLDESKLSSLLLESCASASADKKQEATITEILEGVRTMRSKLANGVDKLATEDAMAIMSLGTTTRSNIDLLFDL